ncbi:MAG: SlyX family protein [Ahrensia sp.]|nr:SlyX family protein [Ahrensia sp.]
MSDHKSELARLDDLEILAAHQARTLEDLNQVLIEQGRVIAELRRKVDMLTGRLEEYESGANDANPTQKPPHW